MTEEEKPLKIREAADALGVDYIVVRAAVERGELAAIRVDESLRIRPADLDAYRAAIGNKPGRAQVRSPVVGSPESPELTAARHYADRARRWVRRPPGKAPSWPGKTGDGPGP